MRLQLLAAVMVLLLSPAAHAGFTFLYDINGSNQLDAGDFYKFYQPSGLLYREGKLYVTDSGKNALYVMNGTYREKILLSSASVNPFDNPLRMAYENGTLYIADGISTVVKTYSGEGFNTLEWNTKQGSNMRKPSGVALDDQYAYITDMEQGRLYLYSRQNHMYVRVGIDRGGSDGQLDSPTDVEVYGNRIFVSDQGKGLIFAYDKNLTFLYTIGRGLGGMSLSAPRGFEIYDDRIYVADTARNRIVVFTLDGYPIDGIDSSMPNGTLMQPEDVALGDGKIFVADTGSRLVKVYELNRTVGNDSVRGLIAAANRSLAQLYVYAPVAAKLNLTFSGGSAALNIMSAQTSYDNFMFTDAAALAQKALDETVALQLNVTQAIELRARQLVKAETERVEPYRRQNLGGSAQGKIVQFDNMVADISAKLSGKAYGLAADAVLSLPEVSDDYIRLVTEGEKREEQRQLNKTVSGFDLQISALGLRLGRLKASSAAYRQGLNLTGAEGLLSAASSQAAAGEFDSANRSIGLAEFEIAAQEAVLSQAAEEIDKGLANLTLMEFNFNRSAAPMLFPPDLAQEQSQLSQAREMVYTNPGLAVAMAAKAVDAASLKAANAQAVSTAASAVLVMLALIGVIALAFSFHIYSRRRRVREAREKKKEEPTHIIWKE